MMLIERAWAAKLDEVEADIFQEIVKRADLNGRCTPSIDHLAFTANCTNRRAQAVVEKLKREKLISIEPRFDQHGRCTLAPVYTLLFEEEMA